MMASRRSVHCTFPECVRQFRSIDEMIEHKVDEPSHNYCSTCDVDCETYQALIEHKVEVMRPYLVQKLGGESPHIVCEFCGKDFGSWGGRLAHRKKSHPAKQDIRCPDCPGYAFMSPGDFIRHIEENKCKGTSSVGFFQLLQQKNINRQIMVDPEYFREALEAMEKAAATKLAIHNEDCYDNGTALEVAPLASCSQSASTPLTEHNLKTQWPRLHGERVDGIRKSLGALSTRTISACSDRSTSVDAGHCAGFTETSSVNTGKSRSAPTKTTTSPKSARAGHDQNTGTQSRQAWSSGRSSRALFPGSSSKAVVRVATEEEELAATPGGNARSVFETQWWNVKSEDYRADLFYNAKTEHYECPLAACRGCYEDPQTFASHLYIYHGEVRYRCRWCQKNFDACWKLIAHTASTGSRCKAKKSPYYDVFLAEMTGGLLRAQSIEQPDILPTKQDSLVEYGGNVDLGVVEVEYTSQPADIRW